MAVRVHNFLYFFIGLLGFKALPAHAEQSIFLCEETGEWAGESTSENHKGCIDVLSWNWGMREQEPESGGATRLPIISDSVMVTKWVNKATPILMQSAASGKVFPKVEIFMSADCCKHDYYKIVFEEVYITSFQTGGAAHDPVPTEQVSFNFTKVELCYTEAEDDGSVGDTTCRTWDFEKAET